MSQLRQQLAQERKQRTARDQQWETLNGRCEQRIRVLEKLRRSDKAEAEQEVCRRLKQLDAERCDEQELCGVRLVSVWRRAQRVRVLQRCVAGWVQQWQASGEAWRFLRTAWKAWAHQARTDGMSSKIQAQKEELALQNREYLTAVSNLKSAAQSKLETALDAQRQELMQKHAKMLSAQQHEFDEQCENSRALLHSVATSMHKRYCAVLMQLALRSLREMSAKRKQQERVASAHARLQSRWQFKRTFAAAFRSWARLTSSAETHRFERLITGLAARHGRARSQILFDAWLGYLQRHCWHVQSVSRVVTRRQRRAVILCYNGWREHVSMQRQTKSALYRFIGRLSNIALWSAFDSWRASTNESRRRRVIVQRVAIRLMHEHLSCAWTRYGESLFQPLSCSTPVL